MIASKYCLPCESVVSFAIFAIVCIVGFVLFIKGDINFADSETHNLPEKPENEINKFEIRFLQNLIKWTETLMEDLHSVRSMIEKKSLRMAVPSFAVIGYLFSDISKFDGAWGGWTVIVYISFGITAVLCLKATDFSGYWPRGQFPDIFYKKILAEIPTSRGEKLAMYHMLKEYIKYTNDNWEANITKGKIILAARNIRHSRVVKYGVGI